MVRELAKRIEPDALSVVHYGSTSSSSPRYPSDESDIDLAVIVRDTSSEEAVRASVFDFFETRGVRYDAAVRSRRWLLELLGRRVDVFIWKDVFANGDGIILDSAFHAELEPLLRTDDTKEVLRATAAENQSLRAAHVHSIARGAHRAALDALTVLFTGADAPFPRGEDLIELARHDPRVESGVLNAIERLAKVKKSLAFGEGYVDLCDLGRTIDVVDAFVADVMGSRL